MILVAADANPAGPFRGKREDHFGAWGLVEGGAPIGDWILLRRCRQFVHEAFDDEDVVRRPDTTPKGSWNARRCPLIETALCQHRNNLLDQLFISEGLLKYLIIAEITWNLVTAVARHENDW